MQQTVNFRELIYPQAKVRNPQGPSRINSKCGPRSREREFVEISSFTMSKNRWPRDKILMEIITKYDKFMDLMYIYISN